METLSKTDREQIQEMANDLSEMVAGAAVTGKPKTASKLAAAWANLADILGPERPGRPGDLPT